MGRILFVCLVSFNASGVMTKLYQALTYFWQMDMMVHLFCLDYFRSTFISIGQKPVLLFRLFRFYSMWFVAALGQLILRRQMDI